ncbi:MAG: sodium:solute symporter family protein, partial [Candidatus Contubernalis sp.]|nr:sodium:solute symporter family protein [Candidatus Contubernalis sp.]
GVGIGALAQPQLATRFMTVRETKSLYRAVLIGGIFIFFMTGTAFIVGSLSNLYFYNHEGMIAIEAAQGNMDSIIPVFISHIMLTWFLYLFMLTLLSAALSTLSSLIHVQGTALGRDILEAMKIDMGGSKPTSPMLVRIGVLVGVVLAVVLAYIMPISIIARATAFWFGICASGFLPVLAGALYWKKGTSLGAVSSIVSGFVVSIFGFVFLHIAESEPFGISQFIFGKDALLPFPWTHIDPLIYALPISAAVYIIVSLLTRAPQEEHLNTVFENV